MSDGVKVRLNEPRLRKLAGVELRPGLQRISQESWRRIQKHPIAAEKIEKGIVQEVKSSKSGRPSASDLVAEIKETYDVKRLEELSKDSRKTVAEAAQQQLDKINSAAKTA